MALFPVICASSWKIRPSSATAPRKKMSFARQRHQMTMAEESTSRRSRRRSSNRRGTWPNDVHRGGGTSDYPYQNDTTNDDRKEQEQQFEQGGEEDDDYYGAETTAYTSRSYQYFEEEDGPEPEYNNADDPYFLPPPPGLLVPPETVQERVDRWKAAQQQQYYYNNNNAGPPAQLQQLPLPPGAALTQQQQSQSPPPPRDINDTPRDDHGRMKLLTTIGKGSRIFIFVLLLWRDFYFYERACNVTNLVLQYIARGVVAMLILGNGLGVLVSMSASSAATASSAGTGGAGGGGSHRQSKKRLKALLNVHKLVELVSAAWCFIRLFILVPSDGGGNSVAVPPREHYIGGLFHSFFFLLQCQAFTKFSWDESGGRPLASYQPPSSYQRPRTTATATTPIPSSPRY
jgi:hypothetical protein